VSPSGVDMLVGGRSGLASDMYVTRERCYALVAFISDGEVAIERHLSILNLTGFPSSKLSKGR
jgi:hypothetical protein